MGYENFKFQILIQASITKFLNKKRRQHLVGALNRDGMYSTGGGLDEYPAHPVVSFVRATLRALQG